MALPCRVNHWLISFFSGDGSAAGIGFGGQDAGEVVVAASQVALTILYDDDILASDGTIL
jgi:hypothetical protein